MLIQAGVRRHLSMAARQDYEKEHEARGTQNPDDPGACESTVDHEDILAGMASVSLLI